MTSWILTEARHIIACSTVQHITITDKAAESIKTRITQFDVNLLTRMADTNFHVTFPNHKLYLQDDDVPLDSLAANNPQDAENWDMLQLNKLDADKIEFESFD
jgi:hypothetical protein